LYEQPIEEGLISVLMSTYNRAPGFLRESIESILNQTYSDFEFIIIDDGSKNSTREIVESYHDPRIKLIVNEHNIGLTNSLNKGLDVCRGEYIARMDDDDIAMPERFEKQMAFMRENPDVIVCGTWVDFIDENGQLTGQKIQDRIEDMDTYRIFLLFGNIPTIPHPSAFIDRKSLINNGLKYDPECVCAQDYSLWVKCAAIGNCAILTETLMKYRKHSKSISVAKNQLQKQMDHIIIQYQLDALHLTLTDSVKPFHYHLLNDSWDLQNRYNLQLKKWIKKLIKANDKYKIYNQKKLKSLLWYRWNLICRTAIHNEKAFSKKISIIFSLTPGGLFYCLQRVTNKMTEKILVRKIQVDQL